MYQNVGGMMRHRSGIVKAMYIILEILYEMSYSLSFLKLLRISFLKCLCNNFAVKAKRMNEHMYVEIKSFRELCNGEFF